MKMKKLIPALAMLLVSAILLGTSTYAWFSMNTTVTATGMEVTAISDTLFLEITGTNDGGTYSSTGTGTLDADLYPAHHEAWTAKADVTDLDLDDDSTNDNWYFRYSDDPAVYNSNMTAKSYLATMDANYIAHETFDVRINNTSGVTTGYDLVVSNVTITAAKGITAVIVGENGYKEVSAADNGAVAFAAADILSNTVTTSAQTIDVYIYFNGDDTNVYSDNISASPLTGTVSFDLNVYTTDQNP